MQITPNMRVSEVLERWPSTYEIFAKNGCPEMRRGFFAMMAKIMKLRWAATVHRIPLERLLQELNECAGQNRQE